MRNRSGIHLVAATLLGLGPAAADMAARPERFDAMRDPAGVVLAVEAVGAHPGDRVRLSVYDNEQSFLETALAKVEAPVDETGVAIVSLGSLAEGDYAFVAYYDQNGDGVLNRGALGLPKERFAFSNGVRPKLRRPKFDEAKVEVRKGSLVVLRIDS